LLRLTRRELVPKVAFASCLAALFLAIATFGSVIQPQEHSLFGVSWGGTQHGTPRCVSVMENAYRNLDAGGVWDCFTPKLQQAFFTNSGLQGNADLEATLFSKYKTSGVTVEVKPYMHNPVCAVPGGSTQQACNAWLLYLTPIVENIRIDQSAGSLTIFINPDGLIWALA
jgi:hypothetical protein